MKRKLRAMGTGLRRNAAKLKIIEESKRVDKGIVNAKKGRLKPFSDSTLTDVLTRVSKRYESVKGLAEKYELRDEPDYLRYENQFRYFMNLLSDEMKQRDEEREGACKSEDDESLESQLIEQVREATSRLTLFREGFDESREFSDLEGLALVYQIYSNENMEIKQRVKEQGILDNPDYQTYQTCFDLANDLILREMLRLKRLEVELE